MSNRFHNKWHRVSHFTFKKPGVLDAGWDPIASNESPFLGNFILSTEASAYNESVPPDNDWAISARRADFLNLYSWGENDHVTVHSNLFVDNNATIGENLYVHGNTTVTGYSHLIGDVSADNNLYVTGHETVGGYSETYGDITGHSNLYINQNATVTGYTDVIGNISGHSSLYVTGSAKIGGDISGYSDMYLSGNDTVSGYLDVYKDISGRSNLVVTGNSYVSGHSYVTGDGNIGGNFTVYNNITGYGSAYITKTLRVTGNSQISGHSYVSGNLSVKNNITGYGSAYITKDLIVTGNSKVSGHSYVTGNSYVSGDETISGSSYVGGSGYITSAFDVGGNITGHGDLYIPNGNTKVTGYGRYSSYLSVGGSVATMKDFRSFTSAAAVDQYTTYGRDAFVYGSTASGGTDYWRYEYPIQSPSGSYKLSTDVVQIAWSDLKNLKDNNKLVAGQQYRITDYVATTVQENTQSAGHQFDIIVVADAVDRLNESARAAIHEGDLPDDVISGDTRTKYFANSNLAAWELKYCVENDTNRFAWADVSDGTGVVYWMKDEWDNECSYDFKGIQFIAYGSEDNVWRYTFDDGYDSNNTDASLSGVGVWVYGNKIKSYIEDTPAFLLNRIVLNGTNCFGNIFEKDCHDITIAYGCAENEFGNYCSENILGRACVGNIFGDECKDNVFGRSYNGLTFGYKCSSIRFKNGNDIKNYVSAVTIENNNNNIVFDLTGTSSEYQPYQNVTVLGGINIDVNTTKTVPDSTNGGQSFHTTIKSASSQEITI